MIRLVLILITFCIACASLSSYASTYLIVLFLFKFIVFLFRLTPCSHLLSCSSRFRVSSSVDPSAFTYSTCECPPSFNSLLHCPLNISSPVCFSSLFIHCSDLRPLTFCHSLFYPSPCSPFSCLVSSYLFTSHLQVLLAVCSSSPCIQ